MLLLVVVVVVLARAGSYRKIKKKKLEGGWGGGRSASPPMHSLCRKMKKKLEGGWGEGAAPEEDEEEEEEEKEEDDHHDHHNNHHHDNNNNNNNNNRSEYCIPTAGRPKGLHEGQPTAGTLSKHNGRHKLFNLSSVPTLADQRASTRVSLQPALSASTTVGTKDRSTAFQANTKSFREREPKK